MGEERDTKAERPENVDSDAEKPRDLEVTGEEGAAVTGGRARRGDEDSGVEDLEIQR